MANNDIRIADRVKEVGERLASMKEAFAHIVPDPNNKAWVKAKLQHMVDVDQYLRSFMTHPQAKEIYKHVGPLCHAEDRQNTADLKELLRTWSWFTISEFGKEADKNAFLLVQHADEDREFQKQCLKKLEALYPKGETSPAHYAYLYDRTSVAFVFNNYSAKGLQRYGTQMENDGAGNVRPLPVEDPEHLEERRQKMGLPPMAEYLKRF